MTASTYDPEDTGCVSVPVATIDTGSPRFGEEGEMDTAGNKQSEDDKRGAFERAMIIPHDGCVTFNNPINGPVHPQIQQDPTSLAKKVHEMVLPLRRRCVNVFITDIRFSTAGYVS